MVTAQQAKKIQKKALKLVKTDERYFLSEYYFIEPMLEEANLIVHGIHIWARRKANQRQLNRLVTNLKKLERKQGLQQFIVRYPKLKEIMSSLINLHIVNERTKNKIINLMGQEHIFENDSLHKTAQELEPLIVNKSLKEIDFNEVVEKITKLKTDLQALTYIMSQLKDAIEMKG